MSPSATTSKHVPDLAGGCRIHIRPKQNAVLLPHAFDALMASTDERAASEVPGLPEVLPRIPCQRGRRVAASAAAGDYHSERNAQLATYSYETDITKRLLLILCGMSTVTAGVGVKERATAQSLCC
jgi:hypothetical protein